MRERANTIGRRATFLLLTGAFLATGPAPLLPWIGLDQAAHAKDGDSGGGSSDSGGHGSGDSGGDNSGPGSGDDNSGPGSNDDNSGPGSGDDNSGPGSARQKRNRQDAVERYMKVLESHGKVSSVAVAGSNIDVIYSDGWRESITGGRYRLYNPNNYKIMDRAARRDDFRRLRAARP